MIAELFVALYISNVVFFADVSADVRALCVCVWTVVSAVAYTWPSFSSSFAMCVGGLLL